MKLAKTMNCKWTNLRPYPGHSASTDGRIRRGKNPLAVHLDVANGRESVRVRVNGRYEPLPVDYLTAYAWLGHPPSARHTVDHLNGDETDCRVENLAWIEPPVDYEWLMSAPPHRGYPGRFEHTLTLVRATYSMHWGTNIFSMGDK